MKRTLVALLLALVMLMGIIPAVSAEVDKNITYTLEFPSWQATEAGLSDWWNTAIAKYNEIYPNVKINFYQVPYANYIDTLTTMFAAGTAPHIVHLPSKNFYQFQDMGWLANMESLIAESEIPTKWTGAQADLQVDGDNYGVLLYAGAYALFYNEAMLNEAGVAVPTTVEELKEAALKMTKKDENGNVIHFGLGIDNSLGNAAYVNASQFIIGSGSHWTKEDGSSNLSDEKLVKALEDYKYFFDNGLTPLGTAAVQLRQYFVEGKIAMYIDGPFVMPIINAADESIRSSLKMTRVPFEVCASNTSHSVHMPATLSETEKELVWDFYQILLTDEMQALYGKLVDCPPPKAGSLTEDLIAEKPYLEQLVEYGVGSVSMIPEGMGLYWTEFTTLIANTLADMVSDPANTVEDALVSLESEINDMLGI